MSSSQKAFVLLLLLINTCLSQYNYLCDFDTKFTANTPGSWSQPSSCEVSQDAISSYGAVIWLGDDAATRSWTDYTIESKIEFRQLSSDSWAGIIFRASSIGNSWDSGSAYFAALRPTSNKVYSSKIYYDNFDYGSAVSLALTTWTNYTLRVEVTGSSWSIYVDGTKRLPISDSMFASGSVGLRVFNAVVRFRTLYITLPTQSPTKNPTNYPSESPITADPTIASTTTSPTTSQPTTAIPTKSPTTAIPTTSEPTTVQPTTDAPTTAIPTNMPSTAPTTALPTTSEPTTTEPTTAQPTNAPTTVSPTHFPTNVPSVSPVTPSPTNTVYVTAQTDDAVVDDITTSENTDDAQGNGQKIAEQVMVLEDWMFIVGGGLFAMCCLLCIVFLFCVCRRIMGKKKKCVDSYNMAAEMTKVTSISNFDTNQVMQVQDNMNIASVSPSAENSDGTINISIAPKAVRSMNPLNCNPVHVSPKSNDMLMMHVIASLTPMGFDVYDNDDFIQEEREPDVIDATMTEMTTYGNTDSVVVDEFHDGNDDMIIESSEEDNGGPVTLGGRKPQGTLGNYRD